MGAKKTFFIEEKGKRKKIVANALEFPNYVQPNPYSCGVASSLSILWYYGVKDEREWQLEEILKTNPDIGTHPENIIDFFDYHGFKTDARKMTIKDIENYVDKGIPVMVLIQARSDKKVDYAKTWEEGHYVVVMGYNKEYLFFDDPVIRNVGYMSKKEFVLRWHDKTNKKTTYINYGIAVYGKKPKYNPLVIEKIN